MYVCVLEILRVVQRPKVEEDRIGHYVIEVSMEGWSGRTCTAQFLCHRIWSHGAGRQAGRQEIDE